MPAVNIDITGAITSAYTTFKTSVTTYSNQCDTVEAQQDTIEGITFPIYCDTNASYNTPANSLVAANAVLVTDQNTLVADKSDMRAKELLVIAAMATNSGVTNGSNQWMDMGTGEDYIGYVPRQTLNQQFLTISGILPTQDFPNV